MSLVAYNGITLPYPDITSFQQEVVLDDEGRTDWVCSKYDITVQGIININYLQAIAPQLLGAGQPVTVAEVAMAMHKTLMRPRRRLNVRFNDVELMPEITPSIDHQGFVDAKNGPQPQLFTFTELTNETFVFTFRIIAHYWMNLTVDRDANPHVRNRLGNRVLFNRWTETVDIDNRGFTTRTREGKYMIRSDNQNGQTADGINIRRDMAIVGVPNGFLRKQAKYIQSPDGLAISYTIVDVEQYKMPPTLNQQPIAYEAEGEYTENAGLGGNIRYGEVWVRLRGGKPSAAQQQVGVSVNGGPVFSTAQTDQALLVRTAVRICFLKLILNNRDPNAGNFVGVLGSAAAGVFGALGFQAGVNAAANFAAMGNGVAPSIGVLHSCQIKVNMYDNAVEVRMRAQLNTSPGRLGGVAGIRGYGFVSTPYSDTHNSRQVPPVYLDKGSAGLLLRAAKYYDPSLQNNALIHGGEADGQMNNGLEIGSAGLRRET